MQKHFSSPAKAVIVFCLLVSSSMIWPIYSWFSRIEPFVLGMPFALVYLVGLLLLIFLVMLGLYLWEDGKGELD